MLNTCIDILATLSEIFMLFILFRNDRMRSKTCLFISCFLYFTLIREITILGIGQSSKLFLFLICNALIGYLAFQNPLVKSIVLGFLQLISVYIGELSIQVLLMFFYRPGLSDLPKIPLLFVMVILLSKVISILCCIAFQKIYGNLDYPYNWRLSFCLIFPLGLILWTMAKIQELVFSTGSSLRLYEEALLSIGLLIAMICLLFIYQYYFRVKELQLQKNISEKQMLSTFRFYEDRLLHETNNRRIYHDIQAHIQTLENMQTSENKTRYSQELLAQLYNMNFPFSTGIETIDVVLNEKQIACQKEGVKIVCIGDFTPLKVLKPMELVTIFHNAIDNALKEYKQYDYPDKLIEIQSWTFHNFIHLRFMNYYVEHEKLTENENPDLHGFGLKNMAYAVERYNGEAVPTIEDGRFYLRIIIPLIPDDYQKQ